MARVPFTVEGLIEDVGEASAHSANDMNVPVGIDLDYEESDEVWVLTADQYQPRRCRVLEGAYEVRSKDRMALVMLVHACWLPLYQSAVTKLTLMGSTYSGNVFWGPDFDTQDPGHGVRNS